MAKASANKPTPLEVKRGRATSKGGSVPTKTFKRERATVALGDNFAEAFKESRGKVAPTLKLGF
jgi:hypothetical protein